MIRKQVMITPNLKKKVDALVYAGKADSFSSVVREALAAYTADEPKNSKQKVKVTKAKKKTAIESLLWIAEHAYKGGPSDLASNDAYLYGPDVK